MWILVAGLCLLAVSVSPAAVADETGRTQTTTRSEIQYAKPIGADEEFLYNRVLEMEAEEYNSAEMEKENEILVAELEALIENSEDPATVKKLEDDLKYVQAHPEEISIISESVNEMEVPKGNNAKMAAIVDEVEMMAFDNVAASNPGEAAVLETAIANSKKTKKQYKTEMENARKTMKGSELKAKLKTLRAEKKAANKKDREAVKSARKSARDAKKTARMQKKAAKKSGAAA